MLFLHWSDTFSSSRFLKICCEKKILCAICSNYSFLCLIISIIGEKMTNTIEVVKMGIYDFWQGFASPWLLWTLPATVAKDLQTERPAFPSSKSMNFLPLPPSISESGHLLADRVWDLLEYPLCARCWPTWVQCPSSPNSQNNPIRVVPLFVHIRRPRYREVTQIESDSRDTNSKLSFFACSGFFTAAVLEVIFGELKSTN